MMRMKKRLTFLFSFFLSVNSLWAQQFQSGDLKYNIISSGESGNAVEVLSDYENYVNLTEVVIPSTVAYDGVEYTVTTIGKNAFHGCNLTSVTIPNSVTTIGEDAFMYTNLISVTIPNSVSIIDDGAFCGCDSLRAFTIPESVTSIGDLAFGFCENLISIEIPGNVKNIGYQAFSCCTGLTSIVIHDGVQYISYEVFHGCSNLTSIFIPASVKGIGYSAFGDCPKIKSIIVDSKNPVYDSRENCNAIILTEYNMLIQGCGNSFIPDGVKSLNFGAFSGCTDLTSITIPQSVIEIDDWVFAGSGLTSITIPNSVKGIGVYAFAYCSDLTSITLPNKIKEIKSHMFEDSSSLLSITIPEGVTYIGEQSFKKCSSLASIDIPASVTSIWSEAFDGCSSLTSIDIPSSVTSIDRGAFRDCSSLSYIKIPDGITAIEDDTFADCSSLKSIVFPKSLTEINGAFGYYTTGLISIFCKSNIPPIMCDYTPEIWKSCTIYVPVGCVDAYKSDEAWGNFAKIVGVNYEVSFNIISDMENTVEVTRNETGEYAGDIVIPNQIVYNDKTYTVTTVASDAFSGCPNITTVTIGSTKTTNESNVTNNPSAARTRAVGNAGITVGERAFKNCSGLTALTLGEIVTCIGNEAFAGCTSLTNVTCGSAKPAVASDNIFDKVIYSNATLTVPEAFSTVYQATNPWSLFTNVKTDISSVLQNKANSPRKIFQNGKLIIRKNGKSYNLHGTKIN